MKTAMYFLAVATFLVAPSISAAQTPIVSGIQASADEISPEVQLYVGRGDELTGRLRYDAAAREYARAADIARRDGHLASGTTWKLATAHYYNGDLVAAAAALDQLTDEAARVGDLEVEALSIYYAAWLDGKAGRGAEMAARVTRLEGLLRSQYLPVALRDRLSGWLKTSREVAAF
jgi:subtilisin family serine protease